MQGASGEAARIADFRTTLATGTSLFRSHQGCGKNETSFAPDFLTAGKSQRIFLSAAKCFHFATRVGAVILPCGSLPVARQALAASSKLPRPAEDREVTSQMDRVMKRASGGRFPFGLSCLALLAGLFCLVPSLQAQAPVLIPNEAAAIAPDRANLEAGAQQALQRGASLEQGNRWGEAILHYEDAHRSFPAHAQIEHRLTVSRLHFDIARRYADSTYLADLGQLSERQSLEVYGEILTKVQANYVHAPDWAQLVQRGALAVDVALHDSAFAEKHLAAGAAPRIDEFLREQWRQLDVANIKTPQNARDAVARAARLGWQQLGVNPSALVMEFLCGATGALDQYSTFLTRGQLDEVYSQIEGNFVGLGVELKGSEGSLLIVHAIPGSPAARGGIKGGDRIVEVNGFATNKVSTDKAADMLKGEEGSFVDVAVVSPGQEARRLRIRRERVEVPSVEDVKIVDTEMGIGYFKLSSFQKTTVRDLDAALWNLHRQGMRSLIIDVRGNPGGLLTSAVEIADRFVEDGTIVSTRGRSPREDFDYRAHIAGTWKVPLVVLVDRDSASASEIFAGAIHDLRRGTIVGERSYGKGSVQGIFPLGSCRCGIRLTTAKFYSPSGQAISNQGVTPDVAVRFTARPETLQGSADEANEQVRAAREEAFISAAVQAARQLMAKR